MTEDDCEIEYLDEDEDIVQQCTQSVPIVDNKAFFDVEDIDDIEQQITPLLVQRKPPENKRKQKVEEHDSDYDPTEDLMPHLKKKRRIQTKKPSKNLVQNSSPKTILTPQKPTTTTLQKPTTTTLLKPTTTTLQKPRSTLNLLQKQKDLKYDLNERRNLEIQIPNYEDPLCLPARAIKNDVNDVKNLRRWNDLCLEYFAKCDQDFKLDQGRTVRSKRVVVLQNVKNKTTGKVETTISSQMHVKNEMGQTKFDTFKSILPSFLEKTIPKTFNLYHMSKRREFRNMSEAVLRKEEHKDGEVLVVYKPKEAISAVYKFVDKNNSDGACDDDEDRRKRRVLKELTCCKICAPCYQASWRGMRRTDKKAQNIRCHVCSHTFVSVYNLLSHLKTHHSHAEVRRSRALLSRSLANVSCKCQFSCTCLTLECRKKLFRDFWNLGNYNEQQIHLKNLIRICLINRRRHGNYDDANKSRRQRTLKYFLIIRGMSEVQVVDYHYKCRICLEKFSSIKQLRTHIPKHQGTEMFTCEIGNHMAS